MKFPSLEFEVKEKASRKELKKLGREFLLLEGIDPTLVDLRDDGISVSSFNKLCLFIYDVGYKDGKFDKLTLKDAEKFIEAQGRALKEHGQLAHQISKENQINKTH